MSSDVCVRIQDDVGRTKSNQIVRRLIVLGVAVAMVCQTVGCANRVGRFGIVDELAVAYRDTVWAKRAYNLRYANCDRPYGDHFENGFCAGYSDVCNGGDGYVPALPPTEYQGYEFQSADGAQCVSSWFEGYPAGVAAAKQDRSGNYHDIYISRMINSAVTQDKAKHPMPSDVPVTQPTSAPPAAPSMALKGKPSPKLPPINKFGTSVFKLSPMAPIKSTLPPIVPASSADQRLAPKPTVKNASVPMKTSMLAPRVPTIKPTSPVSQVPTSVVTVPPIVTRASVDPTAGVTRDETPLPMAMRPVRSATWESTRRQKK